tara:strand:- start:201 stop:368 length:168 start_codon:yes stop_codon:yes gene_type:complete
MYLRVVNLSALVTNVTATQPRKRLLDIGRARLGREETLRCHANLVEKKVVKEDAL